MRELLPTAADAVDLQAAYAYPDGGRWVRANMVASLDGSAVKAAGPRGSAAPADKQVFGVLRALGDAVVVGAGTARAEGYRALRAKDGDADLRASPVSAPRPSSFW